MTFEKGRAIGKGERAIGRGQRCCSALGQTTERVLLGTMVTPLSRRRPWVVAKQIASLDHLSGGRAVLGVGLGKPDHLDFSDLGDEADKRVRGAMRPAWVVSLWPTADGSVDDARRVTSSAL